MPSIPSAGCSRCAMMVGAISTTELLVCRTDAGKNPLPLIIKNGICSYVPNAMLTAAETIGLA